ncbi:SWI/SNF and RSC complex subunit Ssr3 [Dichotomocladium elegans]|nr:SWI/SNF and RSC complex subunit Ssr3 [Dichotomocladium elegans]
MYPQQPQQQQPPMVPAPMMAPQQAMPAQMAYRKRLSEADALTKHNKKKRPTDRNLPPKIEAFVPECKLYAELVDFEKKLDATIMRKRLDIQEALGKPTKIKRTLRVYVSNTSAHQTSSQQGTNDDSAFDMTGNNTPSWTLKIEGRLLDPLMPSSSSKNAQQPQQKFTSFLRSIHVELDRDPKLYPEGNVIEWHRQPNNAEQHDGVEITRRGDANINARISIEPDYNPQPFKLSNILAELVDMKQGTKPQIVMAIWSYIKANKLQDAEDKRVIHCDQRLQQLLNAAQVHFGQIPELINQHLSRPDPVVINYTIRVDKESHQSPQAYDIDVEIDSPVRQKLANSVSATQLQKEIMSLDERIVQCVQSINNSKIKRDFLLQFSENPVNFINKWIASQARDLEVILGESKINLEEMRRQDLYKQPWVKEAVFHYLTAKVQQRMQELLNAQRGTHPPPQ